MSASNNNLPEKILVVDDDASVAHGLADALRRYDVKVEAAPALETAQYLFNQSRFDVVLVEIDFGPLPGLALVQKWRTHDVFDKTCGGFVLLADNKTQGSNEDLVKELGDLEVINKPFSAVQMLPFLSRALATKKRLVACYELRQQIEGFYTKTGNFDKAAEKVLKMLPELGPKGLHLLYDLYERGDRLEDALVILESLQEKEPNNISITNARGRILLQLGRLDDARPIMEQADLQAPNNIHRINQMAEMYVEMNCGDEAVAKMRELVQLTPEDPDIKFELYSKLFNGGLDDHAIKFGKESSQPMEIVRHYNNKGVMLSKDDNRFGALEEYARAIRFYPNFKENYRILFNVALAKIADRTIESYKSAVDDLKECLQMSPDFEKAKNTLETLEKVICSEERANDAERSGQDCADSGGESLAAVESIDVEELEHTADGENGGSADAEIPEISDAKKVS